MARTATLHTQLMPATVDNPPVIRVHSSEGITIDRPMGDGTFPAHEAAALATVLCLDPARSVTLTHTATALLGYSFTAEISKESNA